MSLSEVMDVVNEKDEMVGRETRKKIHKLGLWHKGVHVLVFDRKGNMLLQKRSPKKVKFPNCYDVSLSEHLRSGENYRDAALRGLSEELGIRNVKIGKLLKFKMIYGPNDRNISEIYKCRYSGNLRIDKKEVNQIQFIPLDTIKEMLRRDRKMFASWAREILKWFLGLPSKVEEIWNN